MSSPTASVKGALPAQARVLDEKSQAEVAWKRTGDLNLFESSEEHSVTYENPDKNGKVNRVELHKNLSVETVSPTFRGRILRYSVAIFLTPPFNTERAILELVKEQYGDTIVCGIGPTPHISLRHETQSLKRLQSSLKKLGIELPEEIFKAIQEMQQQDKRLKRFVDLYAKIETTCPEKFNDVLRAIGKITQEEENLPYSDGSSWTYTNDIYYTLYEFCLEHQLWEEVYKVIRAIPKKNCFKEKIDLNQLQSSIAQSQLEETSAMMLSESGAADTKVVRETEESRNKKLFLACHIHTQVEKTALYLNEMANHLFFDSLVTLADRPDLKQMVRKGTGPTVFIENILAFARVAGNTQSTVKSPSTGGSADSKETFEASEANRAAANASAGVVNVAASADVPRVVAVSDGKEKAEAGHKDQEEWRAIGATTIEDLLAIANNERNLDHGYSLELSYQNPNPNSKIKEVQFVAKADFEDDTREMQLSFFLNAPFNTKESVESLVNGNPGVFLGLTWQWVGVRQELVIWGLRCNIESCSLKKLQLTFAKIGVQLPNIIIQNILIIQGKFKILKPFVEFYQKVEALIPDDNQACKLLEEIQALLAQKKYKNFIEDSDFLYTLYERCLEHKLWESAHRVAAAIPITNAFYNRIDRKQLADNTAAYYIERAKKELDLEDKCMTFFLACHAHTYSDNLFTDEGANKLFFYSLAALCGENTMGQRLFVLGSGADIFIGNLISLAKRCRPIKSEDKKSAADDATAVATVTAEATAVAAPVPVKPAAGTTTPQYDAMAAAAQAATLKPTAAANPANDKVDTNAPSVAATAKK